MNDSIHQPNCGACSIGHTPFCPTCVERTKILELQADINHLIVEELRTECIPTEISNGVDAWLHIKELMRLREAQHGN